MLRPAGSLGGPRPPLSRGFDAAGYPAASPASFQVNRQLPVWNLPPLTRSAFEAHYHRSYFLTGGIRARGWCRESILASTHTTAGDVAMAKRILICSDLSPQELRQAAYTAETRRENMRMQAIANAMEGMTRSEAARLADMSGQALKDAILRYNAEGVAGLKDRPHTGRPPKLDEAQRQELHAIALKDPDIETEQLWAYTREDLAGIVKAKWKVAYDPTSIGRLLREAGLSRQKTRPSHPKKNPEAGAAFLKNAGRSADTC
jgi:transposase